MALGTVRYFDAERGFGYIIPDDGSSALTAHREEIVDSPLSGGLMVGWRVQYEEAAGKKARLAREVCVVEVVLDDDDEPAAHELEGHESAAHELEGHQSEHEPEVHEHAMA